MEQKKPSVENGVETSKKKTNKQTRFRTNKKLKSEGIKISEIAFTAVINAMVLWPTIQWLINNDQLHLLGAVEL